MSIVARSALAAVALIVLASCATTPDGGPPSDPDAEMGYVLADLRKEGTNFEMTLLLEGAENRFLPFSETDGLRLFEVDPGRYTVSAIVRERTGYDVSNDPRLSDELILEPGTIVYLGEWLVRFDPRRGRLAIDSIRNFASYHLAQVDETFPAFAGLDRQSYFEGEEDIRLDALESGELAFRTPSRVSDPLRVTEFSQAMAAADLAATFDLFGTVRHAERAELMRRFFGSVPSTASSTPLIAEAALGGYLEDGRPLRLFARFGPQDAVASYEHAVAAVTVGSNAVAARDGSGPTTRRAVSTQMGFVDAWQATWIVFDDGRIAPVVALEARERAERVLRGEAPSPEDALRAAEVVLRDQSPQNDGLAARQLVSLIESDEVEPLLRARAVGMGVIYRAAEGDLAAAEGLLDRLGELEASDAVDRVRRRGRAFLRLLRETDEG